LELVKQLRCEWGVTAPVLFLSFEAEEALRLVPHGDLLTQPGHGFLRLPATVEEIRQELNAVPPVVDPERYRRCAAATALGLLLGGPAADPLNSGPGPTISLLNYWQEGALDRAEVAESLTSNQWWRQWSTALVASRKRLADLALVSAECFAVLERVEKYLAIVSAFVEQVCDFTQEAPTPQDFTSAIHAAEFLLKAVDNLAVIRQGLKAEKEANRV
jgi:hypothetical protein